MVEDVTDSEGQQIEEREKVLFEMQAKLEKDRQKFLQMKEAHGQAILEKEKQKACQQKAREEHLRVVNESSCK